MIVNDTGRMLKSEELKVSPLSEAFLYGRMSFTTLLGYGGSFFGLELHVQRLQKMASLEGLKWELSEQDLQPMLGELCRSNGLRAWARARILLWKESGLRYVLEVADLDRSMIQQKKASGVELALCRSQLPSDPWGFGEVKGYGYAQKMQALRMGYEDALWMDEQGSVGECGTASLFVKIAGVFVFNSRRGLLPSVTLGALQAALHRLGEPFKMKDLTAQDLCSAEGVWIASSLRWLIPVRSIVGLSPMKWDVEANALLASVEDQWRRNLVFDADS